MATTTYAQKGRKQELSDIVDNISPKTTPFQAMIGSTPVKSKLFEWTEEALSNPKDNAAVEGADAGEGDDNILAEKQNYTQIFTKTVKLTGTSQANQLAGNVQTMAHQVALRAAELKKDIEYAYLGTGQIANAGSSAAARRTAGYQAQASTVVDLDGPLTEDALEDVLLTIMEAGGTPDVVMAHPRLISALARTVSGDRIREATDVSSKLNTKVVKFISNAGEVEFHPNLFCKWDTASKTGDVMVFDSSKWDECVLRPYKVEELAKTGDSDAKLLVVEKGLKCRASKSAGLITNVKLA